MPAASPQRDPAAERAELPHGDGAQRPRRQTEIEARHLEAEISKLEAEARKAHAEAELAEVETVKLAGEVEQQTQESRKTSLEIEHLKVGLGLKLLAFCGGLGALLAGAIVGAPDLGHLGVSGQELLKGLTLLGR